MLAGGPEPEFPKIPPDAPPLVRPDRQLTYDGLPHWRWPKPPNDSHTITVDRLSADIDGPPHRFLIHVGDTVELFLAPSYSDLAEVLDVFRERQLVRIRVPGNGNTIWVSVGRIYPAP